MKIIECNIFGFGNLENFKIEFNGLNIIFQDNGTGKSTLAAFIKAMFYGIGSNRGKNLDDTPRIKFNPWKAGSFGGTLTFSLDNGESYMIERRFGPNEAKDTFLLTDLKTRLKSGKFSKDIGFELFSLDSDAYERSIYLSQNGTEINLNDSLSARLNNLILNTDEESNCESAVSILENQRGKKNNSGFYAEITESEEQIRKIKEQIFKAEIKEEEINNALKDLKFLEYEQQELLIQKANLQKDIDSVNLEKIKNEKIKRLDDIKNEIKNKENIINDFKQFFVKEEFLEEKLGTLDLKYEQYKICEKELKTVSNKLLEEKTVPISENLKLGNSKRNNNLFLIFSLLLLTAGIAVMFFHLIIGVSLSGVSIILIILCFYYRNKRFVEDRLKSIEIKSSSSLNQNSVSLLKRQEELTEIKIGLLSDLLQYLNVYFPVINEDNLYEKILELKQKYEQYKKITDSYKITKKKLNDFLIFENLNESETYNADIADIFIIQSELDSIDKELDKIKSSIAANNANINQYYKDNCSLAMLTDKLNESELHKNRLEKQRELISQAISFLNEAKSNLSKRYLPNISAEFEKLWNTIPSGNISEIKIDASLKAKINDSGRLCDIGFQSKGYREIINICLRLALVKVLFDKESPFIILDDPFLNLDDKKLKAACDNLKILSGHCQIIYFTCHQSRANYLAG